MTVLWLVVGSLVGVVNSVTRWWTVARLRVGMDSNALVLTLGGLAVRLALVAALLAVSFRHGVACGLFAFAGLWLARSAGVIWIHNRRVYWPPVSAPAEEG